jgi:two-component system, LuxR family, response regulator FixJ
MTHSNSDTVVLVEDDELVSSTIAAVLTSRGFSVVSCNSAEDFIENFSSIDTKCLILDVELGDGRLNGIDLLRWIRSQNWPLPVILLSGKASVAQIVDALRESVVDIITKPPSVPRLVNAVELSLNMQNDIAKKPNATALRTVLNSLSAIERNILEMLLAGSSNKLIASKLDVGLRSAVRYRRSLLESFGFESIPELANALGSAGINLSEYAFPNPLQPNKTSFSVEIHDRICEVAQRLAKVDGSGGPTQLEKSLESCQLELQKIVSLLQYSASSPQRKTIRALLICDDLQLGIITQEYLRLHDVSVELIRALGDAKPFLAAAESNPLIAIEGPSIRAADLLELLFATVPTHSGRVIWIGDGKCSKNSHYSEYIAKPFEPVELVKRLQQFDVH